MSALHKGLAVVGSANWRTATHDPKAGPLIFRKAYVSTTKTLRSTP